MAAPSTRTPLRWLLTILVTAAVMLGLDLTWLGILAADFYAQALGAAGRGALLGLVAYATYELTNWAVLRDWPALLVPVDILWGVGLTAATSAAGHRVWSFQTQGKR